jgi:ribosome-associated protein
MKKIKDDSKKLLSVIIDGIKEKQGKEIVSLDLSKVENSITKYFVICHADSNTHVNTIADFIEVNVKKKLKEKVWHSEGHENAQWILLDYSNIVVHIFQKEFREYFNLEGLWADAPILNYSNES